jgi:hypothetical protein
MSLVPRRIWNLMSPEDQAQHTPDDTPEQLAREPEPDFEGQELKQQKILNNWLNLRLAERKLWPINPRSDKASTIRRGHPDYTVFLPGSQVLLMEMKVTGGTLSAVQLDAIGILSELGHEVRIPNSAYQAIDLVKKFL